MNSGALQASHRSEEENGTYDNISTKIAGKCGFYSSTTCQCVLSKWKYSNVNILNEEKKISKNIFIF